MHWLRLLGHAVVLTVGLTVAPDDVLAQTRVGYAEGFSPSEVPTTGAQKSTRTQRMRVRALGQEFSLDLAENSRFASAIPAEARNTVGDLKILRGSLADREGSWVRLTVINGRYEGAIWDGSELYGVEPRAALAADQYVGGPATAASVIYRASDVVNDGSMMCGTGNEQITGNALQQYKAFVGELQQSAALVASREIEVAIVGDYEYYAAYGTSTLSTMISRMNVVDGIYAQQLDINIIPTDFKVFTTNDDPFTTTEASDLLVEFGNYRNSTPVIRDRGLAHLFTGRDLNLNTIGVGYVGALCEPLVGVALSEVSPRSGVSAALIIAHEIGHNFGARHDGQAGTACSTTSSTSFLMAPVANNSDQFSSCSVQTMQSFAASAACLTPARTRDVAVSVPTSPISAVINQPFDYTVDVASIGQGTAYNIIASATFPAGGGGFQILSASMPDASCRVTGSAVNCELPSLPAGETRRLSVSVRAPTTSSTFMTYARVTASNDRDPGNDGVDVPVQVNLRQSATVVFTPATASVPVRSSIALVADVTSVGVESLVDAVADVYGGTLQLASVSVDGASCTQYTGRWTCQLQTLAPGQSRHITMQASTSWVGSSSPSVSVKAGATQSAVGSGYASIDVTPQYDIAISPQGRTTAVVAIGDVAEFPITIASRGSEPVPGARMTIRGAANVAIELVAPGVTCAPSGNDLDCDLSNIAHGVTVNGRLRASANAAIRTYIDFDVPQSVPDDQRTNNHFLVTLDVRPGVDVGIVSDSAPYTQNDGVRVDRYFTISSFGAASIVSDVRATITLPASFTIHAASIGGGMCTVDGSTIVCQFGMNQSYSHVRVEYTATEPGDYTGAMELSAPGDAVPTNNSAQLLFRVSPNVDARLVAPTNAQTLINVPLDARVELLTNRYAMSDGVLEMDVSIGVTIESIVADAGVCARAGVRVTCQFDALPANTTTAVVLRLSSPLQLRANLFARFSSNDDVDGANNTVQIPIYFDSRGDAVLTIPNTTASVVTNQRYTIENIEVRAPSGVNDAYVEFFFDSARVTQPMVFGAGCDWTLTPPRCALFDVPTGTTRQLTFSFTPVGTGPLSIRMRVGARNETNPLDNEQTLSLEVQGPTPPPNGGNSGGGASSGGGGGGGGGSMPAPLLVALLGVLLARGLRPIVRASTVDAETL